VLTMGPMIALHVVTTLGIKFALHDRLDEGHCGEPILVAHFTA
jgi:hypothetical protein